MLINSSREQRALDILLGHYGDYENLCDASFSCKQRTLRVIKLSLAVTDACAKSLIDKAMRQIRKEERDLIYITGGKS